jgi:acyl-coenzyme A synthetase/AMP-(fatty) acid ligase
VDKIKQEYNAIEAIRMPGLEELMQSPLQPVYPYTKTWETAKNDIAIIVHTSGSTGMFFLFSRVSLTKY